MKDSITDRKLKFELKNSSSSFISNGDIIKKIGEVNSTSFKKINLNSSTILNETIIPFEKTKPIDISKEVKKEKKPIVKFYFSDQDF